MFSSNFEWNGDGDDDWKEAKFKFRGWKKWVVWCGIWLRETGKKKRIAVAVTSTTTILKSDELITGHWPSST